MNVDGFRIALHCVLSVTMFMPLDSNDAESMYLFRSAITLNGIQKNMISTFVEYLLFV